MKVSLKSSVFEKKQELGVYVNTYRGGVDIDVYMEYFALSRTWNLPKNVLLLEDYREACMENIATRSLPLLADAFQTEIKKFDSVHIALLHLSPRNQAISVLFKSLTENINGFSCDIFSTYEAAIEWLLKFKTIDIPVQ